MVANPNYKIEEFIDKDHLLFYTRGNREYDLIINNNKILENLHKVMQSVEYRKLFFYNFAEFNELYKKEEYDFKHNLWYYTICSDYINEGFFIIKNNEIAKDFFRSAIDLIPYFNGDFNAGNNGIIINFLLNTNKFKNISFKLPDWVQSCVLGYNQNKFVIERCFLMHNYGVFTIDQRISIFKEVVKNKYWGNVL